MSETKSIGPERASDCIRKHIENLILEGSLRPGEPLLPEREMAARLNTSRPTLRDALKALEAGGLLIKDGRTVKVARLGAKSITDPLLKMLSDHGEVADDYLEFRDVVESSAAAMAAERANAPEIKRIQDCVAHIEAAHDNGRPADEVDADVALHIAIYEASHNLVLLQVMRALAENLRTDILHNRQRLFTVPDVRDLLRDQHLAIARAIIERQPEAARSAAHEHLSYLRRAIREVDEAQVKLELSLRRRDSGGLSALKGQTSSHE
ncbi:GntR family transcriptional regulator [Haematobacter missouriensis]|uniref:FCD domain-containing protein n=1 Tax=Haematobacter missouriensis TaxID=366616 RepID=UPI0004E97CB3|nr:FCD domain-containing protein [Haematobacter missouriensis]KFI28282.1 GntR family transcriptional regulator [Haematobacter missouriensis]